MNTRHVRNGLLALSLAILIPAMVLFGALVLVLLHLFFGVAGFVVALVFLLILVWWLWSIRRGMV